MDNKRINVVSQSCANLALKTLSVIAKNNANPELFTVVS